MKIQNAVTVILALLVVFWLGGWMLGLMKHLVFNVIRLALLLAAAAVIVQLLVARRR